MPVCNQPIPSEMGAKYADGEGDFTEGQVCLGLLGATAMIVAGVGVRGMFSRTRRNMRRRSQLMPRGTQPDTLPRESGRKEKVGLFL